MRITPRAMLKFVAPRQGKPMVYPYTHCARWAHWNFIHDVRNNMPLRYSLIGMCIMFPVVVYIDRLTNSPAAVAAYKKAVKAEKEKEHMEHMWADITGRYAKR